MSVCLSVSPSVRLSVFLPFYLSVCLFVRPSAVCLPDFPSVRLSICLCAFLSISLSLYLSIRLSVYLSLSLSLSNFHPLMMLDQKKMRLMRKLFRTGLSSFLTIYLNTNCNYYLQTQEPSITNATAMLIYSDWTLCYKPFYICYLRVFEIS